MPQQEQGQQEQRQGSEENRDLPTIHLADGRCFVWDKPSAETLRAKYRMVGLPVGIRPQIKESMEQNLPFMLLPEQANLLQRKGFVKVRHGHPVGEEGSGGGGEGPAGMQVDNQGEGEGEDGDAEHVQEDRSPPDADIRQAVFDDLWARNGSEGRKEGVGEGEGGGGSDGDGAKEAVEGTWYVTGGTKYGAHFVMYEDDPLVCHSSAAVICCREGEALSPVLISGFVRMQHAVNKTALIATVLEDGCTVHYLSLDFSTVGERHGLVRK